MSDGLMSGWVYVLPSRSIGCGFCCHDIGISISLLLSRSCNRERGVYSVFNAVMHGCIMSSPIKLTVSNTD